MATLTGVSLRSALTDLGKAKATGQLLLDDFSGHQAGVIFQEGAIAGLKMPDHRPRIGMRLVAAGMVSPDQLATALNLQRSESVGGTRSDFGTKRIGDVLVQIGAVTRAVVEQIARTQLADNLTSLLTWHVKQSTFEPIQADRATSQPDAQVPVEQLLAEADTRRPTLLGLLRRLGGPGTVPDLAGLPTVDPNPALGPHDWALLCKIDGIRSLSDLANACGFTILEAAQILDGLLSVGLVTVTKSAAGFDHGEDIDTAALLRELSSLATGASGAARRTSPPSTLPAQDRSKRKPNFFAR